SKGYCAARGGDMRWAGHEQGAVIIDACRGRFPHTPAMGRNAKGMFRSDLHIEDRYSRQSRAVRRPVRSAVDGAENSDIGTGVEVQGLGGIHDEGVYRNIGQPVGGCRKGWSWRIVGEGCRLPYVSCRAIAIPIEGNVGSSLAAGINDGAGYIFGVPAPGDIG